MKQTILILMVIGASIILLGCSENVLLAPEINQSEQVSNSLKSADKPAPKLLGTIHTFFTFTPPTFWNGTVDFGLHGICGITFISYTPPRDYSQASPFEEDFVIYALGTDWTIPENVYLKGSNAGVVSYANKAPDPVKFLANGKIEEAHGPFEMWLGRNVHIRGVVTWIDVGFPEGARGTLRIN